MKNVRMRLLVACLVSLTAGLSACSSGSSSTDAEGSGTASKSSEPFRLLLIAGITGPTAQVVSQVADALRIETEMINKSGGILGRQVSLNTLDDGSDPTKAVSQLQDALAKGNKPDLVYAGVTSAETLALLPVLTREKVLSVSQTNNPLINVPSKYPYHFGISPTADDQIKTFKTQLAENNVKKLSILLPNTAAGQGTQASLTNLLKGGDVEAKSFTYDAAAVDYSVTYQQAMDNKPDAIFMDAGGDSIARLYQARLKVGGTKLLTFGGSGMTGIVPTSVVTATALDNYKALIFSFTKYKPESERPKVVQDLVSQLKLTGTQTVLASGLAFDGLRSVSLAAKQAGTTDADDLKKAMESLKAPGDNYWITQPTGFKYTADNHFPVSPDSAYTWQAPLSIDTGFWK